jgi:hypothetical protein
VKRYTRGERPDERWSAEAHELLRRSIAKRYSFSTLLAGRCLCTVTNGT